MRIPGTTRKGGFAPCEDVEQRTVTIGEGEVDELVELAGEVIAFRRMSKLLAEAVGVEV